MYIDYQFTKKKQKIIILLYLSYMRLSVELNKKYVV